MHNDKIIYDLKIGAFCLVIIGIIAFCLSPYTSDAASNRIQSPGWFNSGVTLVDSWAGIYFSQYPPSQSNDLTAKASYDKALILLRERNRRFKNNEGYTNE